MEINQYLDATILAPNAKREQYLTLCRDAALYSFAAVCVPPFMVSECKEQLSQSSVRVATVVGFPAGYTFESVKLTELKECLKAGAEEIDYVMHRGLSSFSDWNKVEHETRDWVELCRDNNIASKWIVEASDLDNLELKLIVDIANKVKPDYVKTSTGVYGKANIEQVVFLRKHLDSAIKIKAAGGISNRETAESFIKAGANRLGVSNYINLI